jgi:hypothetical protein
MIVGSVVPLCEGMKAEDAVNIDKRLGRYSLNRNVREHHRLIKKLQTLECTHNFYPLKAVGLFEYRIYRNYYSGGSLYLIRKDS